MRILVVGSGGREHALAWKIRRSPRVSALFCAPGNPGIAQVAGLAPVSADDVDGLLEFARLERIDLTVVGPEQPLAAGIVDRFRQAGQRIFGPTRAAAELEWSKSFAKAFMGRHGIPTADFGVFSASRLDDARAYIRARPTPVVLKADGLAAGKGVVVCATREEALEALVELSEGFGAAGQTIVIEEFLEGEEASVFAITDGQDYVVLTPAQDHKRALDGDLGRNTGGMGAYAPAPAVTPSILREVRERIIVPTLQGMVSEGRAYTGCLYVGLMITPRGPKVVEYNCRFGDPETQVVLPLCDDTFVDVLEDASIGAMSRYAHFPLVREGSAVCVVLASGGYPGHYETGKAIHGLSSGDDWIAVFHAGTRIAGDEIVTAGGRVLGVTAIGVGEPLDATIARAYEAVGRIRFDGMFFRRDIGRKAVGRT